MRLAIVALLLLVATCNGLAQHYKVLHSFGSSSDDALSSVSGLVFDAKGNLYGTTPGGGSGIGASCIGCGAVFELSPNHDGTWTESVIYSFCTVFDGIQCLDGGSSDASLVLDSKGNLYGTTSDGGSSSECGEGVGCGVVFELSPPAKSGDPWAETVLYNFCSIVGQQGLCLDGSSPQAPLIFDSVGNLYGTALGGSGHNTAGIIFKLSPGQQGRTQTVLYNFCPVSEGYACPDGTFPYLAGVSFDKSGNLYGTTMYGGNTKNAGGGVVYKLSPGAGGWKETVLAAFPSPTQFYGNPSGGVALDSADNLYGSFEFPKGGVFRLNPRTKQKTVFSFNGADGEQPIGGVTLDRKHGVLYGTTSGNSGGIGDIYEIDSSGKETVLYKFCSQPKCADGDLPWGTLIEDSAGNLYGTTEFGGAYNGGVVFEYTP